MGDTAKLAAKQRMSVEVAIFRRSRSVANGYIGFVIGWGPNFAFYRQGMLDRSQLVFAWMFDFIWFMVLVIIATIQPMQSTNENVWLKQKKGGKGKYWKGKLF